MRITSTPLASKMVTPARSLICSSSPSACGPPGIGTRLSSVNPPDWRVNTATFLSGVSTNAVQRGKSLCTSITSPAAAPSMPVA